MAVDDAIKKILAQSKAKTAPSVSSSPMIASDVSQYENEFRDYLAKQQNARENAVKRGFGSWIPELPGTIADLAVDLPYNIAQRAAGRRGDNIKPLGFGEDVRRGISQTLGMAPASLGETGMSMPPDETNEAVTTALQVANPLAWMAASDPINLAKGVVKGAPKIARSLADELLAPRAGASGQRGAIKLPGGNWLPEGTKALQPLRSRGPTESDREWLIRHANQDPTASERGLQAIPQNEAINQFIDKQLTSYVKNDMATPGDPIRALADAWPARSEAQVAQKAEKIKRLEDKLQNADPRLVPYLQRDIAAVRDEIDAIRSYNPLHFDAIRSYNPFSIIALDMKRQEFAAGNNEKWRYGTSRLAQNWEDAADKIINKIPAGRYQEQGSGEFDINRFDMTKQPGWEFLDKVSPETPLYGINNPSARSNVSIESLGFDHLIDELRNATNPASGLPRELLLKPESLSKLSVPQAVERVAKINEWRASQIKNARLESMLNADVHKEYPEGGMRWVQLNKKGQFAEESDAMGHSVRGYEPEDNGGSRGYGLGGWDAIESGEAKVYSLRDAKGEPHATIEVGKADPSQEYIEKQPQEVQDEFKRRFDNWVYNIDYRPSPEEIRSHTQFLFNDMGISTPELITQIKGKSNRAPNEQYLPYVQDFVKSQPWSDVRDLGNTGLLPFKGGYTTKKELEELVKPAQEWYLNSPYHKTYRSMNDVDYRGDQYKQLDDWSGKTDVPVGNQRYSLSDIHGVLTDPSAFDANTVSSTIDAVDWLKANNPEIPAHLIPKDSGMKRGGPVNQDAMQMAVWNKPVKKAGGSEVKQAEIDAASKPYMMPVPKLRGSIDLSGAKAAGTMLSGMAASIPAGYYGALELLRTRDPKMAADASEAMQERYMSIPEDQRTIEKVEGIANFLKPLSVPAEYVGEKVLGLTGKFGSIGKTFSPLAATAAEVFLDPLNYLPAIGKAPAAAKAVGRAASQIANAELAGRSGLSGQRGVITYHGTPHRFPPTAKNPLGEFDASKIGTGEGAQAYGHGLYFAENPAVSMDYAKNVKDMGTIAKQNAEMSRLAKIMSADEIPGRYREYRTDAGPAAAKQYDALMDARSAVFNAPGNLYTVDLPDAMVAKMLDWDKPLSQQPHINTDNVLDAWNKTYKQFKKIEFGSPEWDSPTRRHLETRLHILDKGTEGTGKDYYEALKALEGFSKNASENLRQAGIPGIRYLDQGSRPNTNSIAGIQANLDKAIARLKDWQGNTSSLGESQRKMFSEQVASFKKILQDAQNNPSTSNFVVFDPAHMNIIGREKKGGLVNQDAMQMAVWDKADKKARGGFLGAAELAANVVKRVALKKAEELAAIEKNIPLTGMMDKAGLQKAAALSNADKAEARMVTLKDFKALGRDDKVRAIASARAAANKTGLARTTQGLSEAFPEEPDMVSSFMASAPYKIRNVVPDEVVDAASASRKSFRSEPSTTPGANASEKEWAAWGKSHGVNMTLTKPQSLGISDLTSGREVMIPGGLSGKFTIPDMFWMKSNNINPASLPQDIHTELMKKFIRTHENKNPDAVDIFNQLDFALLSPSAPLVPNEFLTQRLRIKDMDELRALAGRVGESGLDQSLVNESGVGAALGGGLGIRGTANLKNQAVLADLILRKPEMFQAGPGETLRDVTIRVMNQVPGLGTKTASLGTPWLDLSKANTSAVDLHMIRDATPRLLQDPVVGDAFRSRMANLLGTEPTVEAILAMDPRMVQEAAIKIVGASQSKNYRLASGALNDIPAMAMPDKLLNEPSSFTDFGPFYNRVVDYVDQSRGVNPEIELFPEQWRKWDVIRQRIEPHEFAHPDWRKLPKQSFNEMQESLKEHSRVGYKQSINPAMKTSDWRKMYYGNADPELLIPLAGGAAAASAYLADEAQKQKKGGKVQKKAAGGLTSDDLVLEERKL